MATGRWVIDDRTLKGEELKAYLEAQKYGMKWKLHDLAGQEETITTLPTFGTPANGRTVYQGHWTNAFRR